jgi:hypothetical protein
MCVRCESLSGAKPDHIGAEMAAGNKWFTGGD